MVGPALTKRKRNSLETGTPTRSTSNLLLFKRVRFSFFSLALLAGHRLANLLVNGYVVYCAKVGSVDFYERAIQQQR
jgi:hypothetical protein